MNINRIDAWGGLRLQGQPDGSSVFNILEGLLTEKVMGAVKAIFEGGFKFETSEARKTFNSTVSADRGRYWVALEEQSGSNQGVIGE